MAEHQNGQPVRGEAGGHSVGWGVEHTADGGD